MDRVVRYSGFAGVEQFVVKERLQDSVELRRCQGGTLQGEDTVARQLAAINSGSLLNT